MFASFIPPFLYPNVNGKQNMKILRILLCTINCTHCTRLGINCPRCTRHGHKSRFPVKSRSYWSTWWALLMMAIHNNISASLYWFVALIVVLCTVCVLPLVSPVVMCIGIDRKSMVLFDFVFHLIDAIPALLEWLLLLLLYSIKQEALCLFLSISLSLAGCHLPIVVVCTVIAFSVENMSFWTFI